MLRMIEDMAAAAALAQGGLDEDARAILRELGKLKKSPKPKFIFVTDDPSLPELICTYVRNLAGRLGSHLLVVAKKRHLPAEEADSRQSLAERFRRDAKDLEITSFTVQENLTGLVRQLSELVQGVEFVLVHAAPDEIRSLSPTHPLRVPVFFIDPEANQSR
jgi:hypothetical protein